MDDDRLSSYMDRLEKVVTSALMVMMAVVVVLATGELGWILVKDALTPPILLLEIGELLELFGLFLLVLIGIELLHSVRTYLLRREIHLQAVLTVALIAIARKIVITDPSTMEQTGLLGIAAVVLALAVGYYLVQRAAPKRPGMSAEPRQPDS
jgi:uncharacterized membrane protein (DUF373 family)